VNFVALKMLVGDKLKYIALVAGVAFAALLITQQASIFAGFSLQIGQWVRDTSNGSFDLWVMDDQVEFDNDFKPMSDTALQRVRGVEGVGWAVPMYKAYLRVRLPDGTLVQSRVIGLDDATLTGGPPEITHGTLADLRQDRAVLVNEDQARTTLKLRRGENRDLRVGDRISVNDNDAIVAGFYRAPREFFWDPVLYTSYSRALAWAPKERKLLSYVLVKVAGGQDVAAVAARINGLSGLKAMTNAEFDRVSTQELLGRTGILVNFGITIVLGFVIGLLVAGQTFYTFVLDNLRLFGALKAMGATNGMVMKMMCLQVVTVGSIGYGVGLGAASLAGLAFAKGGLAFNMSWQIPVVGAVAVLCCCLVAGILGMVRVVKLEPAIVFKS
jgi:putative ABC transport system permease protein